MADYTVITTTRTTAPDTVGLLASLRSSIAPEVGMVFLDSQTVKLKKGAPWTAAEKATAQGAIDTAPAITLQLAAQRAVDSFPIEYRALVLALVDQINVLRSKLVPPLPDITPAQAITAIRAKAGSL